MLPGDAAPAAGTGELLKHYAFDATGHIMTATTSDSPTISPELVAHSNKAKVFYMLLNNALHRGGADLSDYSKVKKIVDGMGVFASMGSQDRSFTSSSTDLTLNLDIIQAVLGSLNLVGDSLQIVKSVIAGIGSQLKVKAESAHNEAETAYTLLVCEELMGVPLVTMSIFYLKASEMQSVINTNCFDHAQSTVTFDYHQENYLFMDPAYIDHFSPELVYTPEYKQRLDEIAACIAN